MYKELFNSFLLTLITPVLFMKEKVLGSIILNERDYKSVFQVRLLVRYIP